MSLVIQIFTLVYSRVYKTLLSQWRMTSCILSMYIRQSQTLPYRKPPEMVNMHLSRLEQPVPPPFPRPCWRKTCVYQILTIVELLLLYLISSTVTRLSFWLLDHDDQDYSLWQNDKLVNNVILTPTAVDKDKLLLFLSYGFFHEMWFGGQNLERRFFFFSTIKNKKRKQVTTPALYTMWYWVNGKETSFHPT